VPKLLDLNLDWLLTMLSFWRAQGPLPIGENVTTNPSQAKAAVSALLKHWESEQFPEPRLELLATARLVMGLLPAIDFNDGLAASVRKISDKELGNWKYQEAHRSPAGLGDASDFPDPFDSPLPLAHMTNRSVLGCNTDAEKIHALSTWLSFRPKLEYGPARSILECLEQHIGEPRTRLNPDESAALLISAARFIGLKAHYVQLPSIGNLDGFAPACAAFETKQGLMLSSPGLGILGQTFPSATLPAEEEVRALYHGLRPGHDRLERVRKAAREFPGSGRVQLALAELLMNRPGQIEAALKHAENASRLLPLYSEAHAFHGSALEISGEIVKAHAAFRRASRLRPDSELPFIARGLVLARQTKFAPSIIEFRSALALKPYHLDARSYLAASLSQTNKKKEALEEARMVFRQDDSRSELHMLILDLLFDLDDEDAVIIELEELLAAQPENKKARDFLKLIYKKQGREEEVKSLEVEEEEE
jgi:Flp pilus assembly protein TadD